MSEEPRSPFRPTEYLVPVIAVLLLLAAGVWLYQRSRERARERARDRLAPTAPALQLNAPRTP